MRSIIQLVVAHLAASLDVPVSTKVPAVRTPRFVIADPVGGMSSLDALHTDVAIQAWAKTDAEAEELVRDACDAMRGINATPMADPVPLGADGTYVWWQASFTVHALW